MLNTVINTRAIDFESKGSLNNVAQLTLVNAATTANEAIRKAEFDAALAALDFDNIVESAELSLAAYIATNGTGLAEGTLLYLSNAPARQNRFVRRDPAVSDVGTEADFININEASNFIRTDLTDQYSGADGVFIDDVAGFIGINDGTITEAKLNAAYAASVAKVGAAETYTDLGLVEAELEAQAAEHLTFAKAKSYPIVWGTPDGNGIATATINTAADFGTSALTVRMLKNIGGGYFEHISSSTVEIASNATSVRLRTDSGSIIAATHVLEVVGVPVL